MHVIELSLIAERLRKARISPSIIARVERLNPDGVPEGTTIRGMPNRTSRYARFEYDLVPVREYIARWGADAWRNTPKCMKQRMGGKRYMPTREQMEDGPVSPGRHTVAFCGRPPCKCWLRKHAVRTDGRVLVFHDVRP